MWGAVKDIVKTPIIFVTVVSNMAKDTLPFAWVIIVTPDDSVVGTTQKSAMPCKKAKFKSGYNVCKCRMGTAKKGVTKSTNTMPNVNALGCIASEKLSKHNPLTTKMVSIAMSVRVSGPIV